MRTFSSGATRNDDHDKPDLHGYLSVLALQAYADYMFKHGTQADGKPRSSDNWKLGIPQDQLLKSLIRHVIDVWHHHDETGLGREDIESSLCAVIFNAQALLDSVIKARNLRARADEILGRVKFGEPLIFKSYDFFSAEIKTDNVSELKKIVPRYTEVPMEEPDIEPAIEPDKPDYEWKFDTAELSQPNEILARIYDLGTYRMTFEDFKNRESGGVWGTRLQAQRAIENLVKLGWAKRVEV